MISRSGFKTRSSGGRKQTAHALLVYLTLVAACQNPTAPTCSYSATMTASSFSAQGGTADVTVTTGPTCDWTAGANAAWVRLAATGGKGPAAFGVTVEPNPGFTVRQATVSVAGQMLAITEDGLAPCEYALAPASQSFAAAGGTGTLDVATQDHCGWTATRSAPWLVVQTGSSGLGSGTVVYTVAANTSEDERVAEIAAGGRLATVRQAGAAACSYVLTPTGVAFGPGSGNGSVAVETLATCSWSASSDRPWLRVVSAGLRQASGSGTVRFEVDANTALEAREGRLSIGNQTFVVSQAGTSECSYAVTPVTFDLHWHHQGGQIQIVTQTGCPWTSATDEAWITLTGGTSGSGDGTVAFAVPALTADQTRRGAIKIRWPTPTAGQNVWITHEGCRYGLLATLDAPAAGGRFQVNVVTQPISSSCPIGCSWTAESKAPWIRVVSGSPNAGDNPFTIEIDVNTSGLNRTGIVAVADRTLTVNQLR